MFKKKNIYTHVVPYIMPSLDTLKESILVENEKKETETDNILTSNRLQEIEREAYEIGFESGQKAGFEMGEQKALLLIQRLEKAISDLSELRNKELKAIEQQVLQLSVAIAKRIVLKELSINPDIIANIIKEALMRLQRTGQIRIRMHPSLQEILVKYKDDLINIASDITYELDTQLPLYGAVLIGTDEIIDTDIEEQLNNILDDIGLKIARD